MCGFRSSDLFYATTIVRVAISIVQPAGIGIGDGYKRNMDATVDATSPAAADMRGAGAATRLIIASSIGNALEFYEILVYGYFTVIISKVFFPAPSASRFWRARSARFFLALTAIARAAKRR